MSLLIHPQKKYSFRTGIKLLVILVLIAFSMAFFGFIAVNSIPDKENSLTLLPADFNIFTQRKKSDTDKNEKIKKNEAYDLAPFFSVQQDTTKKKTQVSQQDTTKKKTQVNQQPAKNSVTPDTSKKVVWSPGLQYLLHSQRSIPYVQLYPKFRSGLYDPFQNRTQRLIKIDSTRKNISISETVAGKRIKPVIILSLEDFLAMQSDNTERTLWEAPSRAYVKKEDKKDLNKFMTDLTTVDIPLKSLSFLSIFGPPMIHLDVNGSVKVHAGWRNETSEGSTLSIGGNTHNEPDFSQEIQIGLNGKIGDKLTIGADWGTKRDFSYQNILKIKYTGYDDEIIQSIEAGNVSMQTSQLIGGSEALFGLKANLQIGPLKLQALASQKRSQSQEKSITNGSSVTTFTKYAWDYSTNHYFIDSTFADSAKFYNYYAKQQVDLSNFVSEIEVWKTTTGIINLAKEKRGNAFLNLPALGFGSTRYDDAIYRNTSQQSDAGKIIGNQRFIKLDNGTDYEFNANTGVLTLKTLVNESEGIAVAYKKKNGDHFGEMATDALQDTIIVLKLVKPPNLQPAFKTAWKLLLKNIYSLGGKKINKEGFKFYIKYSVEGAELQDNINGQKLLNLFGLDVKDASGASKPEGDGEFDWWPGYNILTETGEVIFPNLRPFEHDLPKILNNDTYKYDSLYVATQTMARLETSKNKFVLTGEFSASSTSSVQIPYAVENSVKLYLDGIQLQAGIDYTVDYESAFALVTILNSKALLPGANLVYKYEQNDMVNLASKTLLGLRGQIDLNKETRLGFTAMNLTEETLNDKVIIGEEPMSNTMYGVDFSGGYNLPFLTKAINKIFPTNEASKLQILGEYAYINPDPNTKKSAITGDESKSIAYIDDFEGSRKTIPLGSNYGSWHDASFPLLTNIGDGKSTMDKMHYKAKVNWFNDLRYPVSIGDLYGSQRLQTTAPEDQRVTALDFRYTPSERGYYNRWPQLTHSMNWGGMMCLLSTSANNLVDENIQYIEFWMHIKQAPKGAKLYIDLGQISEDVIPNGELDTEDKNSNDAYDAGEDVGLDGLTDAQEQLDTSLPNDPDPSNDDYDPSAINYSKINGTEGNQNNIDLGRLPDTEDLNRNWTLDRNDNFFRFEMPIDTSDAVNPFIQKTKSTSGWYLVRIPLNKYSETRGSPSLQVVEMIRFFCTGLDTTVQLRFADMNLVGNQWRKLAPSTKITADEDEVLLLQTISLDENAEYSSPKGLAQEVDRTKSQSNVLKNEQSINLVINNLPAGSKREIIKDYSVPLDVFNYKQMKMFVHGDGTPSANGLSYSKIKSASSSKDVSNNAEIYLRFGADTNNFYEYRMPVRPGWSDMKIDFETLTSIKQARTRTDTLFHVSANDSLDGYYGIKGNPSLTRIVFLIVGVENTKSAQILNNTISGSVWIDELRVLDADNSTGWSYMASGSLKLADLITTSFSISKKSPFFHRLSDRFGDRNDTQNWSFTTDIDIIKLLPFNLSGSSLKFSYSKTESYSKPLYLMGTDIKVSDAVTQYEKKLRSNPQNTEDQIANKIDSLTNVSNTLSTTETYSLPNIAIRLPATNWFNRDVINGLTLSFNYTKTYGKSPSQTSFKSWEWDASAKYQLDLSRKGLWFNFGDIPYIGDALKWNSDYNKLKIYFFPQTFEFGFDARRNYSYSMSRSLYSTASSIVPNISRDFTTTRYMQFFWVITENALLNINAKYIVNIYGSNAYLLADTTNGDRAERDIWRDMFSNGVFGRDYEAIQTIDFKAVPRLPSLWNINRLIQTSLSYSVRYDWRNDFNLGEIGRSAVYESLLKFTTSVKWKLLFSSIFESQEKQDQNIQEPAINNDGRRGRGRDEREGANNNQQLKDDADLPLQARNNQQDVNKDVKPPVDNKEAKPPVDNKDPKKNEAAAQDNAKNNPVQPDDKKPDTVKPDAGKQDSGVPAAKSKISLSALWTEFKDIMRMIFVEYDKIDFSWELKNSYGGSGLQGGLNGLNNFWGLSQDYSKGPSRLFMLGLSNDLGPRAYVPSTIVSDNISQSNKIDFSTTRPLWSDAEITLNWTLLVSYNKSIQMKVQDDGTLLVTNINATGTLQRSFLSIPPVLMFSSLFNNGIKKVHDLYVNDPNQDLSSAFMKGFETFPWLSKLPILSNLLKYIPRPNWTFTWNGLEKFALFSFAKRASITNSYVSNYSEGWKISSDGTLLTQQQSIEIGFSPLIGLNLSFDNFLGGTFNTSFKFNTNSMYVFEAGSATKNISQALTNDFSISASYTKSGFEIPLFGLALKNDIEFSVSYTMQQSSNILYMMDKFNDTGTPVDGTVHTILNPKIKYNMSSKVNISIYYKRSVTKPDGSSRTIPITTNEAGIDLEIRIGT